MSTDAAAVAAHQAAQSHHYMMHFPPHPARTADPHYVDFNAYHKAHRATARCYIGERIGYGDCMDAQMKAAPAPTADWVQIGCRCGGHTNAMHITDKCTCPPECDGREQPGLELHHSIVEFSLQQGVDLAALEHDYPGISDPSQVGAWIETDANFRWLCAWHHRGAAGAHTASHSDWSASQYVQGLITPQPKAG